jgi:hypothetical protein
MFTDAHSALAVLPPPDVVQRELDAVLRAASILRKQLRLSARAEQERMELTRRSASPPAPAGGP